MRFIRKTGKREELKVTDMGKKTAAVDIGASSGKMALGVYDGRKLSVEEYRDFPNRPVDIGTALYWDLFALYHSIVDGLAYFTGKYGDPDTLGIDTWGASYGLLDRQGRLLEPVYHYRDQRTSAVLQDMERVMDRKELFFLTGCQCNRTYTLPQLYSYVTEQNPILQNADTMLLLPDLLGYFLTGEKTSEMTIAGTSCLMETTQEEWSREVAARFSIPDRIYTKIIDPGTVKGILSDRVKAETGSRQTKLIAAVGHDTASAVAAIPGFGPEKLYISVGTNINMGVEREQVFVNDTAYRKGLKNTGGISRRKIVYRDFSACWHINEYMRTKKEQGQPLTHEEMICMAREVKEQVPWFDVEADLFVDAGGDFCEKMNFYFKKTGQRELSEDGEFIRSIYESIALKTRYYGAAFGEAGLNFREINVISGGTRNELLMQLISNAFGSAVLAGMPYATLYGNLLTQLYGTGEVASVEEMRELSAYSFAMKAYEPEERQKWQELYEKYKGIMEKGKNLQI